MSDSPYHTPFIEAPHPLRTLHLLRDLVAWVMVDVPELSARERDQWVCSLIAALEEVGAREEYDLALDCADEYGAVCPSF